MTMGYDVLEKVTNAKTDFAGANILGFHFEGLIFHQGTKVHRMKSILKTHR